MNQQSLHEDVWMPDFRPTPECEALVCRLFPSNSSDRLVLCVGVALTHRAVLGTKYPHLSAFQEKLITLGSHYSELLACHYAIDNNPNISSNGLDDAGQRNWKACCRAEEALGISSLALLPKDMQASESHRLPRALHNGFMGALGYSLSYADLYRFYKHHYPPSAELVNESLPFKGMLQEFTQARGLGLPSYVLVSEEGPDHSKTFTISVKVGSRSSQGSKATSKRRAETEAAKSWLQHFASDFLEAQATLRRATAEAPQTAAMKTECIDPVRAKSLAKHFGVKNEHAFLMERALTHSSVITRLGIKSFQTHQTLASFGNRLLHVAFLHNYCREQFRITASSDDKRQLNILLSNALNRQTLRKHVDTLKLQRFIAARADLKSDEMRDDFLCSFFESVCAARFLSLHIESGVDSVLDGPLRAHFNQSTDKALSQFDAQSSLAKLAVVAGIHRIGVFTERSVIEGPTHNARHTARIRLEDELNDRRLIVRGGKGTSGKEARQALAKELLTLISQVHSNLDPPEHKPTADLLEKLASLLLRNSFSLLLDGVLSPNKWAAHGLLGSPLVRNGDLSGFRRWLQRAETLVYGERGIFSTDREALLAFYGGLTIDGAMDLQQGVQDFIQRIKAFASAPEALQSLTGLQNLPLFGELRELLMLISLMAKQHVALDLQALVDDLSLLSRQHGFPSLVFRGDKVTVQERQGALLELFTRILRCFASTEARLQALCTVEVACKGETSIVSFTCSGTDKRFAECFATLKQSLLVTFLRSDLVLLDIKKNEASVECSLPLRNDFAVEAMRIARSPRGSLDSRMRAVMANCLHDLKNHLVAAEVAISSQASDRTQLLRSQTQASEHLDAVVRISDQFSSLANTLVRPPAALVNLGALFQRFFSHLLQHKPPGISLRIPAGQQLGDFYSSESFIESILFNLAKNAIEAMGERGTLDIAWQHGDVDGKESLTFTVADDGPGIQKEFLERLLRGESVPTSKRQGNGIGMLTVRGMIQRLEGSISATSSLGSGSSWTVVIPSTLGGNALDTLRSQSEEILDILAE